MSRRKLSHVILDEIHERDKFADFLLIELREMIKSGKLEKLVLMSATIDVHFFLRYFQCANITPKLVQVDGRTGTIEHLFLEVPTFFFKKIKFFRANFLNILS